ncbi:MAG: 1-deoxy-D-xylulose-5-phosphate reductoisomerase [Wolinella sp.]
MILLGSTGSIGQNALSLARDFHLPIEVLVAGHNLSLLNAQIAEFQPKIIVIADSSRANELSLPKGSKLLFGKEGIIESLHLAQSSFVLNALVGFLGLRPTLESLRLGKTLALANKESLVAGGSFVDASKIIPVDSEHFSLWFLKSDKPFSRLFITASGGAFRDTPLEEIPLQKAQAALRHPNWSMGRKITVDSATMVNKLFEILEARWLFNTKSVDALIERNSLVHALIGYPDGSFSAHIAQADMRLPLAYAMLGELDQPLGPPLELERLAALSFEPINPARYPLWNLKEELLAHPWLGITLNAANEVAVEKFLEGKILFGEIPRYIERSLERFSMIPASIEELFALDSEVRQFAHRL